MTVPVSVIITVFERLNYLADAIKSALDQTLMPLEIIVTDDSSSKKIETICNSFNHAKIRYRNNKLNLGVALNVRAAISEAKGKYIAILNDDDIFEPAFIEKLIAPLRKHEDRVLAFSDYWFISQDGKIDEKLTDDVAAIYGRDILPKGEVENLNEFVLEKNGVPLAMAAIFRKDALNLKLLSREVEGAYDFWISCLLASTGRPVYYVHERLSRYRMHEGRESERISPDRNNNMVYIYEKLIELNFFPSWKQFLENKKAQALLCVGIDNLKFGQKDTARKYFKMSFKTKTGLKTLAAFFITFLPEWTRVKLKLTK